MKVQDLSQPFQDRIARFNKLFQKGTDHDFEHDELFGYEMFCIESALGFAEFLPSKESMKEFLDECEKEFKENPPKKYDWETKSDYEKRLSKGSGLTEVVDRFCKKYPDNNIHYEDHSGNSMGASWNLFITYVSQPELIPYMHGCLAGLVGDRGYYDDRSDIPKITNQ